MRRRPLAQLVGLLLLCTLIGLPSRATAQALDAPPLPNAPIPCPPQQVPQSANPLVRSLSIEWALLKQDWCKLTRWDDTWPRLQYLLVDLFTGPGLHPTAGIVVPDGGAAGGLALNVDWNTNAPDLAALLHECRGTRHGGWLLGGRGQAPDAARRLLGARQVAPGHSLRQLSRPAPPALLRPRERQPGGRAQALWASRLGGGGQPRRARTLGLRAR